MYATRPTSYVTHFKRALSFGEAQVSRTGDTKVEMRLATREDPVKNKIPAWMVQWIDELPSEGQTGESARRFE
jgi:hypothetical protein